MPTMNAIAISAWIEAHRRRLTNGGTWVLGGEPNLQPATAFEKADVNVLIARLSAYHDVAAGITHSFLWQLARGVTGAFIDLAFFPPAADERAFSEAGLPLWFGTTTREPPTRFDILAISNSVVQELLNLPAALKGSGIALDAATRERQKAPLIVLGGSNSYATGILHGAIGADGNRTGLVDVILAGDAEEAWPRFLELYKRFRDRPRSEFLVEAARTIRGCFVPALYKAKWNAAGDLEGFTASAGVPLPVQAARADLSRAIPFREGPILFDESTAGSSHLLISAGCPYFCSFCKESWEQKPYRERDLASLTEAAGHLKAHLGLHELSLMTFNVNTVTYLHELLTKLEPQFERVSIKSQRFDAIARTPQLLERQLEAGKRTYTCAMEGISDRVRHFLQKGLPETILLEGFRQLFQRNLRQMKIFLIVTGNELEADLQEFSGFLSRVKALMAGLRGKPILTFSLAALFRPPFTPLQFEPLRDGPEGLETWMRRIEQTVKKAGFECRISAGPWDALVSEYLAYADSRSTPILVKASIDKRFRYRGEVDRAVYAFWQQELRSRFSTPPFPPGARTAETVFPWETIDTGISRAALYRNYRTLLSGSEHPTCIAHPLGTGICEGCGACPDASTRQRLTGLAVSPPRPGRALPVVPKRRFRLIGQVSRRLAPVGNRFLEAAFARLIMLGARETMPELVPGFGCFVDTMPRGGAFGLFLADFTLGVKDPVNWKKILTEGNRHSADLEILDIQAATNAFPQAVPAMLVSRFHLRPEADATTVAREIDALLAKYRIKHQKRWDQDTLRWDVASGQAKTTGFSQLLLPRDGAILTVQFLSEPEPHLLSFFHGLGDREIDIPREVLHD